MLERRVGTDIVGFGADMYYYTTNAKNAAPVMCVLPKESCIIGKFSFKPVYIY